MVRFLIGFIGLAVVGACGCGGGAVSGGAASDAPPADAVPDVGADPDSVDGALLPDVTASDAGDLEGPAIDVLFPTEDATVSGVVTVHVVAEDPSGVTSLEVVVQGEALVDSNPLPAIFLGAWATTSGDDGPSKVAVRAVDGRGNERHVAIPVVVHNGAGRLVAGRVSLGWPVRGAPIGIYERGVAGSLGLRLNEGTTDSDGMFSLSTGHDAQSGWGVLVVEGPGGQVEDPLTGEALSLSKDDALMALVPLPPGGGATVVHVNLWTTVATRLATGLEKWGTAFDSAPGLAEELVAEHLQRPEIFELTGVAAMHPADPGLAWDSPAARLGVTHVGLARLAADHDATILDTARLLAADVSDAVFDGLGSLGGQQAGPLKWPDAVPVHMEDSRYHLALALVAWASGEGTEAGVTLEQLDVQGGLLDTIAGDEGPLYPEPGQPFDEDSPLVVLVSPTPAPLAWVTGEALTVVAVVQDESPIASFSVATEPPSGVDEELVGSTVTATVELTGVEDGELVIVATAVDGSRGALVGQDSRVVRVDRTPPVVSSVVPAPGASVSAPDVKLSLDAADSGSGVASVAIEPGDSCVGCGQVELALVEGRWEGTLPLIAEGEATWLVVARDVAGNQSTLPYSLVRDTVPPALVGLPSPHAPAEDLTLAVGTTPDQAVFEPLPLVDLRELCCLAGDEACAAGHCAEPLSILAGGACGPMPAVLRLEASDAGPLSMLATLKSAVLVTTLGPQPVEGGELEVPLCGGALGQQLLDSAPGVVHELTVTVTDDAGNVSAPVVLELEVEPVLPPIRVAMVSGVDEWDLANFSFQDGTLHVPFAPAGEGGADDLPGRYRLARYEVVNPWDLDLLMVSSIAAPLQVERGVRRSYLKLSGAQNACSPGQCAYLWKDLLPGEDVPQGPCTLAKTFPVELETLDVEQEVVVIAGGTTKPLAPTTKVSLPAHGSVAVDLLAPLAGTCFVTAPTVHSYAGSQTLVYEPKPSCEGVPASADVLPFGYTSSTASCMLKASAGGGGGVFANPRIIEALYVNSIVSDAPGLFVNYSAVGAEVRSGASAPVKGSFFKELPNFEVTPSVEPY